MRRSFTVALVLAAFALTAQEIQAQVELGPQVSVAEDVDVGIGANINIPLRSIHPNLEFSGNFTFYFPDKFDYWELDADVRYLFPLSGNTSLLPYAMAGLAIGDFSVDVEEDIGPPRYDDSELGLRIGGGFKVPMETVTPFVDLALMVGDLPDFTLRGGFSFPIGN